MAERALAKITGDIAAGFGGLAVERPPSPPLSELAEDWIDRRRLTHRACRDDESRWRNHLGPFLGRLQPDEVKAANVRRFVEAKLAAGLSSTTVGHCVRLLSSLFTDLIERDLATANPVRAVPRSTRRLYRNAHDPRTTPFLERADDIRRVYLALPRRYGVMFAIGALGGLRPGEVLGLDWRDVDLSGGRIVVRQQVYRGVLGPVKDDEARIVPVLPSLLPALTEWRLATGGAGMLFKPRVAARGGRPGSPPRFVREHTLRARLRPALAACGLPPLTWYQATRHTFASQWVMGGGSIEKLAQVLGHADITTTQRYAHLRTDLFREADLRAVTVDLSRPGGEVVDLAAHRTDPGMIGHGVVMREIDAAADGR